MGTGNRGAGRDVGVRLRRSARGRAPGVRSGADAATRADPWFVRVREYPGVGWQLAGREALVLPAGAAVTRGSRALVADGALDDDAIAGWATDAS
ncbi:DUF6807 family protein [Geodermatophilus sp. SYSU D01045]